MEEWHAKPLLPCYDMCKAYVIACTNNPTEVTKMCNDTTFFSKQAPCTGHPYTVEAECDGVSALSVSWIAILAAATLSLFISHQ